MMKWRCWESTTQEKENEREKMRRGEEKMRKKRKKRKRRTQLEGKREKVEYAGNVN